MIGEIISAVAGGIGGIIGGSLIGSEIDKEKKRLEQLIAEYEQKTAQLMNNYNNFSSSTDIISAAPRVQNGLSSTYLTDLSRAFKTPNSLKFQLSDEEI